MATKTDIAVLDSRVRENDGDLGNNDARYRNEANVRGQSIYSDPLDQEYQVTKLKSSDGLAVAPRRVIIPPPKSDRSIT